MFKIKLRYQPDCGPFHNRYTAEIAKLLLFEPTFSIFAMIPPDAIQQSERIRKFSDIISESRKAELPTRGVTLPKNALPLKISMRIAQCMWQVAAESELQQITTVDSELSKLCDNLPIYFDANTFNLHFQRPDTPNADPSRFSSTEAACSPIKLRIAKWPKACAPHGCDPTVKWEWRNGEGAEHFLVPTLNTQSTVLMSIC